MFTYKSYDEAHKMKDQISNAILGHDSVVSIGTEEQKTNNSTIYSVKIGLVDGLDERECERVLTTLYQANLLAESPNKIGIDQKRSLFKHVGVISAQTNTSSTLNFLYSGLSSSKRSLGVAALAGGLAACVYGMSNK